MLAQTRRRKQEQCSQFCGRGGTLTSVTESAAVPPAPAGSSARPARSPSTARDRARAEIMTELLAAARARLESEGSAALSLRAVARDLGMASSAVYRYVP